jgi:hypothetical protein
LTPDSQRLRSDSAKAISETTPFKQLKTTMLSVENILFQPAPISLLTNLLGSA